MKDEKEPETELVLKRCNNVKLAAAYGISLKVLRRKLKDHQHRIGERKGHKYSLEQVVTIVELIGMPLHSIE